MLRQIFAFLALVTGFAALTAPAQAGVADAANVSVQRQAEAQQVVAYAASTCVVERKDRCRTGNRVLPAATMSWVAMAVSAVWIGPDRARE